MCIYSSLSGFIISLLFFYFMLRALRVRKKMSGERMPVKMIGDILTAQLPHMQPYIRFCSCQLNGAALIQQKTDEVPDFKEFVKVRKFQYWYSVFIEKLTYLFPGVP